MIAPSISTSIDWSRPWYASVRAVAEQVMGQLDLLAALNQHSEALQLVNHRGLSLRFVEQSALPDSIAYESFISATGQVPSRDNLHDLFNALVWLSFPYSKRQLNLLQAAQIERAGIGSTRGAARDAATIFDENAAILVASDTAPGRAWVDALRNHHWRSAFIDQRTAFGVHGQVWLFGHALLEKLVKPYKSITAHAWVIIAPEQLFSMALDEQRTWLDVRVANELAGRGIESLHTGSFTPLPILGVPGWWQPQGADFYADASVFRAKRIRNAE